MKHEILYVECDPGLSEVLSQLSHFDNYDYRMVKTNEEAKECLSEADFDILIIDSQKKAISGIELLRWCRERGKHMPVIMLSSTKTLPENEIEALGDCCTSILIKPFSFDDLVSAIYKAKNQSHDFDCRGKVYKPGISPPMEAFPGMHYF